MLWHVARKAHEYEMTMNGGSEIVALNCADGDPRIGAALRAVCEPRLAVVCARDEVDDRQPEAGADPCPSLVGAAEPVEGPRKECRRYSSPFIGDVQFDPTVPLDGGQFNRAGSVNEGVLDQVVERLLESCRVAVD